MHNQTKKNIKVGLIGFITISIFALSGCGSSTNTTKTPVDERSRLIDNTEFSVKIPREWDVIEPKDFTSDVPSETLIVFRNNVKNENFTVNVNIIKKNLQKPQDTLEFAKEVINRQKNGLLNYQQSKQDLTKMTVAGKQVDSYTMLFQAKKDVQSDSINFFQTYATKGNFGYIITGSYAGGETSDNINIAQTIVKSFGLK